MTLPIAISVPHAGLQIPDEAARYCQLTSAQITKDGDEFAAEIFDFRPEVSEYITTEVARAIVDLNRAPNDRRPDGVVKTHTIWNEPIYSEPIPDEIIDQLLANHYHPYHRRLSKFSKCDLMFAVDCHTMAAEAPPIGPAPGTKRPEICIGNVQGQSFPASWTTLLHDSFQQAFAPFSVTLNEPFAGGYICQYHGREMPWVQLEVSRSEFLPHSDVKSRIIQALSTTCRFIRVHPNDEPPRQKSSP
jgi:N-formylglutamate deformylase